MNSKNSQRAVMPSEHTFGWAVGSFLGNMYNFRGRSTRSDCWNMITSLLVLNVIFKLITSAFSMMPILFNLVLSAIWALVIIIPGIALLVRRMLDCGLSAGGIVVRLVLALIPIVDLFDLLVILYDAAKPTDASKNKDLAYAKPTSEFIKDFNVKQYKED